MKLTVLRGGGIAGIVARTELDAGALPPPDADAFAGAVARAGLPDLQEPQEQAPPTARPDAQLYEICLEGAGQSAFLRCTEESLPENVRQLLAWVDSRPERVESIER